MTGLSPAEMDALKAIPVSNLRALTYPSREDRNDAFTLTTADGMGYVDQGTGALLVWQANGPWARLGEWVYLLHTGEGAAVWGLILGLLTLAAPVLVGTGTIFWLGGHASGPCLHGMARADRAETVILVASESGSTCGCALAVVRDLQRSGGTVHLAPLARFAPASFAKARRIVLMAATYGEGEAPAKSRGMAERLAATPPHPTAPLVILGFCDRGFRAFSAFADGLDAAARKAGLQHLLPLERIDHQSAQAFARWSRAFGQAIGIPLDVVHQPAAPRGTQPTLTPQHVHGGAVQAPTAILRFALPRPSLRDRLAGRSLPPFQPGDLLGILPEGSAVPRTYSLAFGSRDGLAEIVVRKHAGGLCLGQLVDLEPGKTITAFVRPNPAFRPDRSAAPLVLIGAGTGIGPLAGFIRANRTHRPVHLWFGARHPPGDILYADNLRRGPKTGA